jgi:hypothetical protein
MFADDPSTVNFSVNKLQDSATVNLLLAEWARDRKVMINLLNTVLARSNFIVPLSFLTCSALTARVELFRLLLKL